MFQEGEDRWIVAFGRLYESEYKKSMIKSASLNSAFESTILKTVYFYTFIVTAPMITQKYKITVNKIHFLSSKFFRANAKENK